MKPIFWDDGTRWDDPNAYWGSPSYRLEPGDPGYVPVAGDGTFTQTTKKKKNTMPKQDYIQAADDAFAAQLTKFKTGVGGYSALLGVTAAQMAAQAADADCFAYVLACQKIMQDGAQQWTAWKNLERAGGSVPASGAPVPPAFPAAVGAVTPGIEVRFRALVKQIKANASYNEAIGEALGIEGAVHAPPPGAGFQPVLSLELRGGQVYILWGWQGNRAFLDSCEIHADRGDGHGFALLVIDTTPNYTDTTPLPATPGRWKYKAIYRKGDARTGQWSDEVAITVGG